NSRGSEECGPETVCGPDAGQFRYGPGKHANSAAHSVLFPKRKESHQSGSGECRKPDDSGTCNRNPQHVAATAYRHTRAHYIELVESHSLGATRRGLALFC